MEDLPSLSSRRLHETTHTANPIFSLNIFPSLLPLPDPQHNYSPTNCFMTTLFCHAFQSAIEETLPTSFHHPSPEILGPTAVATFPTCRPLLIQPPVSPCSNLGFQASQEPTDILKIFFSRFFPLPPVLLLALRSPQLLSPVLISQSRER